MTNATYDTLTGKAALGRSVSAVLPEPVTSRDEHAVRICAPMAAHGRVMGVLFFDYSDVLALKVDFGLAKAVADQCALLVERAAVHAISF